VYGICEQYHVWMALSATIIFSRNMFREISSWERFNARWMYVT